MLKRFVSLLLLFSLLCSPLLAVDTEYVDIDINTFLELPKLELENLNQDALNLSQSSQSELLKLIESNQSLQPSDLESMNAFQLLETLEESYNKALMNFEAAVQYSQKSESELLDMRIRFNNCKILLESYKKALISNKDDTHYILGELVKLSEDIKRLEFEVDQLTRKVNLYKQTTIWGTIGGIILGFIGGSLFVHYVNK